jgi:glycosyltransferase involved in cell wall biosynthesis
MLSVIIPTRNRAPLLRLALESLRNQTLPPDQFEVLVIDNGSTDDTRQAVQSCQLAAPVRYFFDPVPGLHVGRHRGLKEARGDILVYGDDDIEATPTWLEAIAESFLLPGVALVGGNNYPRFEDSPPSWLDKAWSPAFGGQAIVSLSVLKLPAGRRVMSPFGVWGCNFSIRKDVLLEAGGFHPDGMPDEQIRFRGDGETHVSAQIASRGLICMFDSRASVHHAVTRSRMSFQYFRKRAFNQGISDSYTSLRGQGHDSRSVSASRRVVNTAKAAMQRVRDLGRALWVRDPELRELGRLIRAGYAEGYRYHQDRYRNDPEVRTWVHRPDYF